MISLVLPYWKRQAAANAAIEQLGKVYAGADLEVIVVDDGNPEPFEVPQVALDIRVIRLPLKQEPKCPATAWNAGARAARGDIIALSCVEILHPEPVLVEMAEEVRDLGPLGYVLAAAWCPDDGGWHCHSSVTVPDCKPGSGIAFCGAMHRSLFELVGGFGEEFRDGAGYEDRDLIRKLEVAGAKFVIRDDLKVIHPKAGAHISWAPGGFERNEAIYRARWS